MKLVENYLQMLYTDMRPQAKEWRGPNIPYGDEDNRPNLIRKCFTFESDRQKINCLRKLRDQAAMNPFYQARLDRFVDAITGIYEPTDQQGTIPGNEFKQSNVGEDLVTEAVSSSDIEWEAQKLSWLIKILQSRKGENQYANKACKSRPSHQRSGKICRIQAKIKFNQQLLSKAMTAKNECKSTKNPEKCKVKAMKQIIKIRKNILAHQNALRTA